MDNEELYKIIKEFSQKAGYNCENPIAETIQIIVNGKRTVFVEPHTENDEIRFIGAVIPLTGNINEDSERSMKFLIRNKRLYLGRWAIDIHNDKDFYFILIHTLELKSIDLQMFKNIVKTLCKEYEGLLRAIELEKF